MKYKVPKGSLSEPATGTGFGIFKCALNEKYIHFDHRCFLTTGDGKAHGIFAWDSKRKTYRYWWFEDSGRFSDVAGDFVNNETLFLEWHGTSLTQTFKEMDDDISAVWK